MGGSPYGFPAIDQGAAAQVQNSSGIPSDWTQLAQSMGFMPNVFANRAQQMMDATRFMALQKNILDSMAGGAGGPYSKMSPGNPTMSMPLYMKSLYDAYGSMANSAAGMMLAPTGSQNMLNQGSYQFGGLGNNMSPLLTSYLAQMQGQGTGNQVSQNDITRAAGSALLGPGNASSAGMGGSGGAAGGAMGGGGGANSAVGGNTGSPITVNTSGTPIPATLAAALQKLGIGTVPQGVNLDNLGDWMMAQGLGNAGK